MSSIFEVQSIRMNGNFNWLPSTNFLCAATGNNQEWSVDLTNTNSFTGSTWGVWSDKNSRLILSARGDTEQVGIGLLAGAATRTLDVGGQARIQAASSCNILSVQTTVNGANQIAGVQLGIPSGQAVTLFSRTQTGDVTDFGLVTTSAPATSNVSIYVAGLTNSVGIGNNSPQFKLDVSGTARVSGTGTPFNGLIIQNTSTGGAPTSTSGATLNFRGYNLSTGWSAQIRSTDGSAGQQGGMLMISTKPANNTDNSTLNEAVRITETQNVGIGTTTPSSRLHVSGTTTTTGLIVSGLTGYIKANAASSTTANATIPVGDLSGTLPVANGGTGVTASTGTGSVVLSTNPDLSKSGTNYVTIKDSTSGSGGMFWLSNANTESSMRFTNSVTGGDWVMGVGGWTSGCNFVIGDKLYITTNGRVGIGTNTPSYTLDVNGTIRLNKTNTANNKLIVLWDGNAADPVATATNFNGFGLQTGTLRYQVDVTGSKHSFFCGTTEYFRINSSGGANPSDRRLKSNIEDITDALSKINVLQGKIFNFNGDDKRQMGFIAQEVVEVVPEVVRKDEGEDGLYFMSYDKLTALLAEGIKELHLKLKQKENEIQRLSSFLQEKFPGEF